MLRGSFLKGSAGIISVAVLGLFAAHVLYCRVLPEVFRACSPASSTKIGKMSDLQPAINRHRPVGANSLCVFLFLPTNLFALAELPEVQSELGISDEQELVLGELQSDSIREVSRFQFLFANIGPGADYYKTELREAEKKIDESLMKVLDASQLRRLHELAVQYQGVLAFWIPAHRVTAELGLTDKQLATIKSKLHAIYRDRYPATALMFEPGKRWSDAYYKMMTKEKKHDETGQERCARFFNEARSLAEQQSADVLAVLTEKQRAKYREMRGKEFQFTSWSWWADQRAQERGEPFVPLVTPNEK